MRLTRREVTCLSIHGLKRVFCIDERRSATKLLHLRNRMEGKRCLATTLGPKDLWHAKQH